MLNHAQRRDPPVVMSLRDFSGFPAEEFPPGEWLTPPELAEYSGLRHPDRRREWLGARLELKRLLRANALIGHPAEAAIIKDRRGRPRIDWRKTAEAKEIDCSISHKAPYVMVAYTLCPGMRIGVDVERISSRLSCLGSCFHLPGDRLLAKSNQMTYFSVLWSLKEAASKVTGEGFGACLSTFSCREVSPGLCDIRSRDGWSIRGRYCILDGYVSTTATG